MPRKLNVDTDKLVAAIESGRPSAEIMTEFGIKTLTQLKALYVDALMARERVPSIISLKGRAVAPGSSSKEIRVNNRGSLIVPKEFIDEMGFEVGASFSVQRTDAGVSLKRAK